MSRSLPLLLTMLLATLAVATPSASAAAGSCPDQPTTHAFSAFGDPFSYVLAAGGTLEDGGAGWTLDRASVVAGNEPFLLNSADDTHSLAIDAGGTATSPASCVSLARPTARFVVRSTGSPLGLLVVSAVVQDGDGVLDDLPAGVVTGLRSEWSPSLPVLLAGGLLDALDGPVQVRLRFHAVGTGASFQVDDVYIDPYGKG